MADRGYRGRPQRGERADRQINAGHSRGLDVALSDTEAKIRKLKTERIYAYDQNGKEIKAIPQEVLLQVRNYQMVIITKMQY